MAELLAVARNFGWEPAGTAPATWDEGGPIPLESRDREEHRTYFSNDFRSVTASDARALAGALFRALDAVRTSRPMTPDRAAALRDADLGVLDGLALYAWKDGFVIG